MATVIIQTQPDSEMFCGVFKSLDAYCSEYPDIVSIEKCALDGYWVATHKTNTGFVYRYHLSSFDVIA